jgi:two-component system chemotaxis response regulator CheY
MRVLVADDSTVMRRIVVRTLRQAGFDADVTEVTDGREAYEAALSDTPDLVLSDWNMPNMTGIESLRAIRAAGSDVTFGFVTSEGSDAMRATAEQAGAAFLITKPFTPESFREALEPYLG